MKSFDLFRTLTQARGDAGEDSVENHYPIKENVVKVQPGDIVVSEYETHRADKARAILTYIGLPDTQLITTDRGKSDFSIWPKLKAQGFEITEHMGDNLRCDIQGPQQHGIKATQVFQHEFSKNENALLATFPNLAKTMREARLATWHEDPKLRELQLAQIEANFPMLYLASLLLHKQLTDQTVLMSSRDCFLWVRLMRVFQEKTGASYRPEYFHTSRICREFPSETYLAYLRGPLTNAVVVDLCGTGRSLSLLLQRVGKPDTPIYFVVQYAKLYMEQAYGPCKLGNIKTLIKNGGANLERANLAPHAMIEDLNITPHEFVPVYFNPCNIDWNMPEITSQVRAFEAAAFATQHYPLDLQVDEALIQAALQQTFQWIRSYELPWSFATKFLIDEDNAVMKRLKCNTKN